MQYVLGNMLNGGGGLNADGLSLDLQFAADKTLTARRGPTPTFTRASSGTFVGSDGLVQTAGNNVARFDHTADGVCRGLLIEESRTNVALRSDDFSSASWGKVGSTVSSNSDTSPDGSTTADKIVENTGNSLHGVSQFVAATSGSTYINSVYVKAAGRNFAMIYTGASGGSGRYISIPGDGSGSVLGNFNANNATVTLQYVGNGWYRATILMLAGISGNSLEIYTSTSGTSATFTGDGTSGVLVWGAQIELGSFATSYIPTTTASVVRSADVCSITGADFTKVYNESEHTLFAQASAMSHANFGSYLSFDNGVNEQSSLAGFPSPNRAVCYAVDGGTTQANPQLSLTLNQSNKMAAGMKLNSFQVALNGALGTQDTSGTMPTAVNLRIGRAWNATTISGTYAQVKIFKKRLSNAKLQALTV
jgi:hypothetical protein